VMLEPLKTVEVEKVDAWRHENPPANGSARVKSKV
jgi:hypothetical protein